MLRVLRVAVLGVTIVSFFVVPALLVGPEWFVIVFGTGVILGVGFVADAMLEEFLD